MIDSMLLISLVLFGVAGIITLVRIIIGPSLPDRIVGLDMVGVILVSVVAIVSVLLDTNAFLEVILVLAILTFIGTVAFSRYIERGVIIERKRNR